MIKTIISPANPIIKHIVTLHSAKYRAELQEFIAEGFRTISTIIKAGHQPITLFTTEEFLYDAQQLANDKQIIIVSPEIMDKISTAQSPSGLLATFKIVSYSSTDS